MTALPLELLKDLQSLPAKGAWAKLISFAWETCSPRILAKKAADEVLRRDRAIAPADLFLATAGWDLWLSYYDCVPRTAENLSNWWRNASPGRAILILDGLSLRESPWLVQGAERRGYTIHHAHATGAELPADTSPFAKALGFGQRSALESNGAGTSHKLQGARTESVNLPWKECVALVDASTDWVLWHHWPDERIHVLSSPGPGLSALAKEAAEQLASEDFWALVRRLTTGRRLVIAGDHGYAAAGLFPDMADQRQVEHLRSRFKSGRSASGDHALGNWTPPIDAVLDTPHGKHAFVLGRRKWKSPGGYPTLTHGGLSLLEVAVPFIELSRPAAN